LMKKGKLLTAIEVKNLDSIGELNNYIHPKKLWHLEKTLASYLRTIDERQFDEINIDAVFIKGGKVIEIYENITNS
jgi:Holliday junction resolvase-like predicted endonuclease